MRLSFRVFVLNAIIADLIRWNGGSEAFSVRLGSYRPCISETDSGLVGKLALYPTKVEENDFRTPAASFTFTRCATSTITSDFVQSEWDDAKNDPQRLSYLDVISSLVPVPENPVESETEDEADREPLAQAHRIQQAYREWCEFYGKTANKERLGVFAANFLQVQEFHERTGRPLVLNALADMTEEEYRHGKHLALAQTKKEPSPPDKFRAEDRIRNAYKEWCEYYGRTHDEKRFQTFASNFIAVEKYHMQTKQSLVLNEFADMTDREYQRHMATAAHFTTPENVGPRSGDSISSPQHQKTMAKTKMDDPITSYLDPEPTPNVAEESQSVSPFSQTHVIESSISEDTTNDTILSPEDDGSSSATYEVISALQKTVSSLTKMVKDMASATQPVTTQTQAQPLDSLVIDVLQQQDDSIAQLEESVEGLHVIQMQSSDLIELVSSNQRQMTDMMTSVQAEVAAFQEYQRQTDDNYALLLERIEDLEAAVAKYDSQDPVLNKSLVLTPATASTRRMVQVRPNIPPIAGNPMFRPINLDPE